MDVRATIGLTVIFGVIAIFLWNITPRLMRDFTRPGDYVPARSHTLTDYKCTNVNGFMFNHCSATFVSRQAREPQEITDWRFGRAPHEWARLLERRDDASAVTTDVSLRTVWNRMAMALFLLLFGVFLAMSLIMKSRREAATPGDASASIAAPEPAREPARAARVEPSGLAFGEPKDRLREVRGFGRRRA
jgi:preprotein translocase subunit SecG